MIKTTLYTRILYNKTADSQIVFNAVYVFLSALKQKCMYVYKHNSLHVYPRFHMNSLIDVY